MHDVEEGIVSLDRRADYRYLDEMATTQQLMDADTFLARPESPWREELIDGQLVVNEPTWRHQMAAIQIVRSLIGWIEGGDGTGRANIPVNLRISDRDVLSPDVLWYADAARVALDAPAQLEPPDLVVEVRSQSTWRYDVGPKRERYERWGVGELWLVDGESRTVRVCRRSSRAAPSFDVELELGEDDAVRSPLLPGFELPVRAIFAVPGERCSS